MIIFIYFIWQIYLLYIYCTFLSTYVVINGGQIIKLRYKFIILLMFISLLAIGVVSASEDVNFNKNKTERI